MAVITKGKFWSIFSAFVAGLAAYFGLTPTKIAAGRTIEMRLADVSKRIELSEKEQGRDIRRVLDPRTDRTHESDTKTSQWRDYRWDDWRDYRR